MKEFNNGACRVCENIGCEHLQPVRYTDDIEPYVLWECIEPGTSYWFEECPKGIR